MDSAQRQRCVHVQGNGQLQLRSQLEFSHDSHVSAGARRRRARVSVVGKCIVQKINRTTGAIVQSLPNYNFQMDALDGDKLTPKVKDAFTITVKDTGNVNVWHTTGEHRYLRQRHRGREVHAGCSSASTMNSDLK